MKTVKVDRLYSIPPLYDMLYNTNSGYKMGEAVGFGQVLTEYRPKAILEMFAGHESYHKRAFKETYHYADEVKAYKVLDAYADANLNVIVADPADGEFGTQFDAILAYFRSGGCIYDPSHPYSHVTRAYCERVYVNVFKHLAPGGVFILDFAPDGYREAVRTATAVEQGNYETYDMVPLGNPLRQYAIDQGVPIADTDVVELSAAWHTAYDRQTGNMVDIFQRCHLFVNQVKKIGFKIAQPMTQRLFGEAEYVDMLRAAGFGRLRFFRMEYTDQSYNELFATLDNTVEMDGNLTEPMQSIIPNVIVAERAK